MQGYFAYMALSSVLKFCKSYIFIYMLSHSFLIKYMYSRFLRVYALYKSMKQTKKLEAVKILYIIYPISPDFAQPLETVFSASIIPAIERPKMIALYKQAITITTIMALRTLCM
jgi:hypothetical protein